MNSAPPAKAAPPSLLVRMLSRAWVHVVFGFLILLLDLLTGPYLLFPILFVLPVALSAWYSRASVAYTLAVLLPIGRFFIAELVDRPAPFPYTVANAVIRIVVLLILAYLVVRTARQTRQLEQKLSGLVTICAWSRTIEYQGEWLSFEEYLKRRFDIDTSHGISPDQARKHFGFVPSEVERGGETGPRPG